MATNDELKVESDDIDYGQKAPSKTGQVDFVPGKASENPLDANWPQDFKIPTGNPAIDDGTVKINRVVISLLGRNTVGDMVIAEPELGDFVQEAPPIPGISPDPFHQQQNTTTEDNDGDGETPSSSYGFKS